jgi:hypothetical protein
VPILRFDRPSNFADSMSDYLIGCIDASDRIPLHTRSDIAVLRGERRLKAVTWRHRVTGVLTIRPATNVFLRPPTRRGGVTRDKPKREGRASPATCHPRTLGAFASLLTYARSCGCGSRGL